MIVQEAFINNETTINITEPVSDVILYSSSINPYINQSTNKTETVTRISTNIKELNFGQNSFLVFNYDNTGKIIPVDYITALKINGCDFTYSYTFNNNTNLYNFSMYIFNKDNCSLTDFNIKY